MAVGLGMMAVLMIFVPLVPLLWALTGVLLLVGIVESLLDVGGNTLIVWVHRREVGPFMNGLHFFFGVGAFLSPLVVARAIVISGEISWAYWTLSLVMLPVVVWLWFLPNPVSQTAARDDRSGTVNYLLVGGIALFMFLYVGAEVSFGGWIYTYAFTLSLADKSFAAYLTAAFWGALTVGRLLSIPLAAHFKPGVILFSHLGGCLASVGLIILAPYSFITLWVGALGLGLSMAPIFPTILSFSGRQMTITGKVTGWFLMVSSVGAMTLPWIIGQLVESIGPHIMMFILLIDLIGAVVILTGLFLYSGRR